MWKYSRRCSSFDILRGRGSSHTIDDDDDNDNDDDDDDDDDGFKSNSLKLIVLQFCFYLNEQNIKLYDMKLVSSSFKYQDFLIKVLLFTFSAGR